MSEVAAMLKPLIEQARAEGKWLWCRYQDLWFTPDQLASHNAKGQFCWGPVNWELRSPQEKLDGLKRRADAATAEYERVRDLVGGPQGG